MKPINVLSLFDGISSGMIALERAGISVNKYYASEIDKYAMQISKKNWPEIVQLGDIRKFHTPYEFWDIDLLLAGSPCTNLSFGGKQEGFATKCGTTIRDLDHYLWLKENKYVFIGESYLFWEFIKNLRLAMPKYFLLENVPMKKAYLDIITKAINDETNSHISPILIDSAIVSAQTRKRYYWTNIPNIKQLEDKKINLRDILETAGAPFNYSSSGRGNGKIEDRINEAKKALTLTRTGYNKRSFTGVFIPSLLVSRKLSMVEMERLQTLDDNYTNGVSDTQRRRAIGNGWTVDVIAHILKGLKNEI